MEHNAEINGSQRILSQSNNSPAQDVFAFLDRATSQIQARPEQFIGKAKTVVGFGTTVNESSAPHNVLGFLDRPDADPVRVSNDSLPRSRTLHQVMQIHQEPQANRTTTELNVVETESEKLVRAKTSFSHRLRVYPRRMF